MSENLQAEIESLSTALNNNQWIDVTNKKTLILFNKHLKELSSITNSYGLFISNAMPTYFVDNHETTIEMTRSLGRYYSQVEARIQPFITTSPSMYIELAKLIFLGIDHLRNHERIIKRIAYYKTSETFVQQRRIAMNIVELSHNLQLEAEKLEKQIEGKSQLVDNSTNRNISFAQVVVVVEKDFDNFSEQDLQILITKIRSALQLSPEDVHLAGISRGSIQIILEMPEEQAKRLIAMFIDQDKLISDLEISRVELAKSASVQSGGLNETSNTSGHIQERSKLSKGGNSERAKLRVVMTKTFNETEIDDLAFDLGINDGHLPGKNVLDKVREIIMYSERHGMFESLYEKVNELRPGRL